MRKLIYLLFSLFILVGFSQSQTTTVTATVQYPDGQVFANGTVSAFFTPVPGGIGQSGYLLNGAPFPYTVNGTMDGTGTFTIILTDDTAVRPLGGKWNFTLCSQASVPCTQSLQDVSGSTLNLSTRLNASVSAIFASALDIPRYYADSEVATNPLGGQIYYNLPSSLLKCSSGSTWAFCGSGGTGASGLIFPQIDLGVSWQSDLYAIEANIINAATDSRVTPKVTGNGSIDDAPAIRAAIAVAVSTGGGTVYLPPGTYKIVVPSNVVFASAQPLRIPSNVILRGYSSATTIIDIVNTQGAAETDNIFTWGGISFLNASKAGMSDLTLVATPAASSTISCAALWNRGGSIVTDVFFNNMNIQLNNCRTMWFTNTTNFVLRNSTISYTANAPPSTTTLGAVGPVLFTGTINTTVTGNTFNYNYGRVHINQVTNFLYQNNIAARDALGADLLPGVESGGLEFSYANHAQIINNTFTTANFLQSETGDGEIILTQQTNANAFNDAGVFTAVGTLTFTDSAATWNGSTVTKLATFSTNVVVTSGPAIGEVRTLASVNTGTKVMTLTQPWGVVPSVGDLYAIVVFPCQYCTIQGNILTGNPQGIQMFDGCYNCLIGGTTPSQANILTDSRQILIRTFDGAGTGDSRRKHRILLKTSIIGNTVSNTLGVEPAYIALDDESFGGAPPYTGMSAFQIAIGNNIVSPWPTNPSATYPTGNEISQEGFFPCFIFGGANKSPISVLQSVYFWNNTQTLPVTYVPFNDPTTVCASLDSPPAQWSPLGWLDVGFSQLLSADSYGGSLVPGHLTELITLSTVGTTTDSVQNLLPANSIIDGVVAIVTTTITTATDWELGDATIAGRFTPINATLVKGTQQIGTVQVDQTGTSGPRQLTATPLRITTTGTPGAGAIRVTVFFHTFVAMTN